MTRNGLPERELRGLLEILGEVHHAEDLASFRQGLLDVLPRVVPSVYTSYNEITPDGQPLVAIVSPEPEQQWLELWGRLGHQNPLIQRYLSTRDPRAYRMSDVIDAPTFRRLDLYREVFAPLGVHHQMAVTLPAPPRLLNGLAVVAPDDYTDAQRRMLDLARPHLIQARANAAARERLHDVLHAIENGLDDVGQAIVVTTTASASPSPARPDATRYSCSMAPRVATAHRCPMRCRPPPPTTSSCPSTTTRP